MKHVIERAIVPYNPSANTIIKNEQYQLFAPIARRSNVGMAAFDPKDFDIREGVVYMHSDIRAISEAANNAVGTATEALGIANASTIVSGQAKNAADNAVSVSGQAKNAADNAVSVANEATSTAGTARELAGTAMTIANGATRAVSFNNYQAMIDVLNALDKGIYRMGQNIYIIAKNVPDLWVSAIGASSYPYTYVSDASVINALETRGFIVVGYYQLSPLETQKVNLTDYVKKSTTPNTIYGTAADGSGTEISYSSKVIANAVVQRNANGSVTVDTPVADTDATNKKYVEGYVEKYVDQHLGSGGNGESNTPSVNLDNYYNKPETESLVSNAVKDKISATDLDNILARKGYLTEVPDEYVTENDLKGKGYLTTGTAEATYAKLSDLQIVKSIAEGATQAISFANYSSMVDTLSEADNKKYTAGQNFYIAKLGIPDVWVYEVSETYAAYTYQDDDTLVEDLVLDGTVAIGYYKISPLETQKVNLTDYVTKEAIPDDAAAFLRKIYKESQYIAFTGTLSMTPATSTYEIGRSVDITFSWTFNKIPTEVVFNYKPQALEKSGSAVCTVTSDSDINLGYNLTAACNDEEFGKTDTIELSKIISFRNKYFWGCAPMPSVVNSEFIAGLKSSGWATKKEISFSPSSSAEEYIWYAYPKRLGKATMFMGGFEGGFKDVLIVPVTNAYEYTEDYYVYRSTNAGISLSIQAK